MHKLTSADLADIEARLRAMRVEAIDAIRARLSADGSSLAHSLGSLAGEGDQAVEDMLTDTEIALLEHELGALRDIDAALKRIEFDVAGICTVCGAAIPVERLRALPAAAMCVRCAARAAMPGAKS